MGTLTVICVFSLIVTTISSLPIITDSNYAPNSELPVIIVEDTVTTTHVNSVKVESIETTVTPDVSGVSETVAKRSNVTMRNSVRPGMLVNTYEVTITPNVAGRTFSGSLLASITITDHATREDELIFRAADMNIHSVRFSIGGSTLFQDASFDFDDDDQELEISTGVEATTYRLLIEYTGNMGSAADGLFSADDGTYIGMNLYPTNARRVFPCIDEPTEPTTIRFTFEDVPFNNIVVNSLLEDGSTTSFRALNGPPHMWGMIAHSFIQLASPTNQLRVFARQGLRSQDNLISVAILDYFREIEEWTEMPYFEVIDNQNSELAIVALADTNVDWYALSTIGIWEPDILLEIDHSLTQRKTMLVKLAEAMSRQWFGQIIYPENWRHQWVISGLVSYTGFEMAKNFQTNSFGIDITLIDMNTVFVTDVIQESLYRDGYTSASPLLPDGDIFDEEDIRIYMNGVQRYKAPAILRMLRLILGREDDDFIQTAGQALLQNRRLQTVSHLNFYDAINGYWTHHDYQLISDVEEFMEPWVDHSGYPMIEVGLRQGGVRITQEHFGFSPTKQENYLIPLTFTTSINPNYDDIHGITMMDQAININMALSEGDEDNDIPGDYVLFNLQGQGYYRVTYDDVLWDRIIDALDDPDRREEIHPLNRATLVDDALNLARAGKLDYDIAFRVVLTMEHETEYAVWKAFDRNMKFLKRRLEAYVFDGEDDDLDPDIYLRMVRRTIIAVEEEIGFYPDTSISEPAMTTITRGLVMDHACRAGYQPCIAAAVDWFYDPNNADQLNPNIPRDMRPAVYCAMVREGGQEVLNILYAQLEEETDAYERVVILQSLACSNDGGFIDSLLLDTITANSGLTVGEKAKIFQAVAESSYENCFLAIDFMTRRTNEIRNAYGGPSKLEEMIYVLAESIGDGDQQFDFSIWVNSLNSNLFDSEDAAALALAMVNENQLWDNNHRDEVYDWIDENDAPTLMVSCILIYASFVVALINY